MSKVTLGGALSSAPSDTSHYQQTVSPVGDKIAADVSSASTALALQMDEASSTVTYVGLASVGSSAASALWQIKKITVSGTTTAITWADGNGSFDNVWNNRAALSYS